MQGGFYPGRHWGTEVLQPSLGVGTDPEFEWGNLGGTKQHHDRHLAVFVICPQTSPLTLQRSGCSIFPTPQFFPFWLSFFLPPFLARGIKSRGCHMVGKYSALGHLHSSSFCHFSMVLPVITVLRREDPWGRLPSLSANPPTTSPSGILNYSSTQVLLLRFTSRTWRGGSVVSRLCCCTGPRYNSHHPYGGS